MGDAKTWRWTGENVPSWDLRPMARSAGRLIPLALEAEDVRSSWLVGFLTRFPALLGDFAYAAKTDVTAWQMGEDACVIDWRTKDGQAALLDFVRSNPRIYDVHTDLTLTCLDQGLEPIEIVRGAEFYVSFLLTESGALNTTREDPAYLRLALNADIYAPRSHGEIRDNTRLAALNGPRLTGFLQRIERDVPAQLLELDDEGYRGMIGPHGFLPPAGARNDA
jgi:hypothetical protein